MSQQAPSRTSLFGLQRIPGRETRIETKIGSGLPRRLKRGHTHAHVRGFRTPPERYFHIHRPLEERKQPIRVTKLGQCLLSAFRILYFSCGESYHGFFCILNSSSSSSSSVCQRHKRCRVFLATIETEGSTHARKMPQFSRPLRGISFGKRNALPKGETLRVVD